MKLDIERCELVDFPGSEAMGPERILVGYYSDDWAGLPVRAWRWHDEFEIWDEINHVSTLMQIVKFLGLQ